jgi:ABC-type antimicrobial peptide transport system permease subunit
MSLRRPRNLITVVFPYVALGVVFVPLAGFGGLALLALSPSPVMAPRLAPIVGARSDQVGALSAGTLLVSVLVLPGSGLTRDVPFVMLALGAGVLLAQLPTVRDALLPVLDAARYVALAIILVALVLASGAAVRPFTAALAAAVLVVGVVAAVFPARRAARINVLEALQYE